MFIGKVLHNDAQLVMVWEVNDACPGHFLQIFKPLVNVTFISNSSRALFEKNAVKVYPKSRDDFEKTMLTYDVNLVVRKRAWWSIERSYWEKLQWTREIDEKVEQYVAARNVCSITAMHFRRTDLEKELYHMRRSSNKQYYRWVDSQPEKEPVYFMTDDPATQHHFIEKYGQEKIYVYANMSFPTVSATNDSISNATALVQLAPDHRFTTLEHAIIDVLIAAHAKAFRPGAFSSVSNLVRMFHSLHWQKWCT